MRRFWNKIKVDAMVFKAGKGKRAVKKYLKNPCNDEYLNYERPTIDKKPFVVNKTQSLSDK